MMAEVSAYIKRVVRITGRFFAFTRNMAVRRAAARLSDQENLLRVEVQNMRQGAAQDIEKILNGINNDLENARRIIDKSKIKKFGEGNENAELKGELAALSEKLEILKKAMWKQTQHLEIL